MSARTMWSAARSMLASLARRGGRFVGASEGLAAVEFALVLPVMVLLYFGMVEISVALMADRKVVSVTRTVADLTGSAKELTTAQLDGIFGAGKAILSPYDASRLKITVSSIVVKTAGSSVEATVCWSRTWNGSAQTAGRAPGAVIAPVPAGFATAKTSFILAEVEDEYVPMLGTAIFENGTVKLGETTAWPVRNAEQVKFDGTQCPLS